MNASVPAGGALALSPAAVGGRRHKLRLVTKKVARKALKKLGLKMRGGEPPAAAAADSQKPVVMPQQVLDAAKMGGAAQESPVVTAGHRRTRKGGRKSRRHPFGY